MTKGQKQWATTSIHVVQEGLQTIVNGQHESAHLLDKRRQYADWELCYLLRELIPTLPQTVREQVQACYDLREQVWSAEYAKDYYDAQEKASPSCLAAADSL